MKAKAFFSNISTNIRLELTDDNGNVQRNYFTCVSSLVNFFLACGIELLARDCTPGW